MGKLGGTEWLIRFVWSDLERVLRDGLVRKPRTIPDEAEMPLCNIGD